MPGGGVGKASGTTLYERCMLELDLCKEGGLGSRLPMERGGSWLGWMTSLRSSC